MSIALSSLIAGRLSAATMISRHREPDVEVIELAVAALATVATFVRDDPDAACELIDLTVIDRLEPGARGGRFLLVVLLVSRSHGTRARLEIGLEDDNPSWPTLSTVWPTAWLYEREAMDLFGVIAEGHTNPRRLLVPETFVGPPARLDYRITKRQLPVPQPEHPPRLVIDIADVAGTERQ